jgi:hypothetical protein
VMINENKRVQMASLKDVIAPDKVDSKAIQL